MESITVSISNDYQQPIKKVDNHSTSLYRNTLAAETIDIDIDAVAEEDLELNNADSNKSDSNFFEKVGSAVSGVAEGVTDFFEDTAASVKSGIKTVCNGVNDWAHDVHEWWNNDASPFLDEIRENFSRIITSTGATITVGVQSFVEGLLNFGESIVDFGIILGTVYHSIDTLFADAVSSLISGKSFDASITKAMWDNTMAIVSQKYVSTFFDSLYENTKYGQFLKNNAFGFDTVRGVGSGIGYVAGVSALTIATFGVGGAAVSAGSTASSVAVSAGQMAVVAGAAGVGKGAQDSWADGASLGEGLAVGVLTGIWEGLQFYVGAKIGGSNIAGSEKALNKILSGLARVTLDGLDGGVEGFIQPLIASVYKDGYTNDAGKYVEFDSSDNFFERYREIFDDYGGWTNVFTQAAVGVGSSLIGEAFDLRKYLKKENKKVNTTIKNAVNVDTDFDIEAKLNRYNEILDIMKSDEYKRYVEYGELGYAQELKPEFYGIERELASLENDLTAYSDKINKNTPNIKNAVNVDTDFDMEAKLNRYNEILDIMKSDEYQNYLKDSELGHIQNRNSEFYGIERELANLENDLTAYYKKNSNITSKVIVDPLEYQKNISDLSDKLEKVYSINQSIKQEKSMTNPNMQKISLLTQQLKNAKNECEPLRLKLCEMLSLQFKDPDQFVYSKLKQLYLNSNGNNLPELKNLIDEISKTDVRNIDSVTFQQRALKFLSEEDKQILEILNKDTVKNIYTDTEKDLVQAYTKYGGPAVCAYLRDAVTDFGNGTMNGKNKSAMSSYMKRVFDVLNKSTELKQFTDIDSFAAAMDGIIDKSPPLPENMVVYRGANSLFLDNNRINTFDIGQRFNDAAFVSTSCVPTTMSHGSYNIVMEIEVPKGTKAAYLEQITGVRNYNQQELLLKRNSTFEIIDMPSFDPETGQTFLKVKLVEDGDLVNNGATNKFIKNYSSNYIPEITEPHLNEAYKNQFCNITGMDAYDFFNKFKQLGLEERYNREVDDMYIKKLYHGIASIAEHDYDHVKNVMLYSMYMGKEMNLKDADFNILVDAAKYHDVGVYKGNSHMGHAVLSAEFVGESLGGNYSTHDLGKLKSIIEFHEIADESFDNVRKICEKYEINDTKDINSVIKIGNILKDADAIDRTRFPGNLKTSYYRNKDLATNLTPVSFQIREKMASNHLNTILTNRTCSNSDFNDIINLRKAGFCDFVIDFAYKYHGKKPFSVYAAAITPKQ